MLISTNKMIDKIDISIVDTYEKPENLYYHSPQLLKNERSLTASQKVSAIYVPLVGRETYHPAMQQRCVRVKGPNGGGYSIRYSRSSKASEPPIDPRKTHVCIDL